MTKVMTFARVFPTWHLRKGDPTMFVESLGLGFPDCVFKDFITADFLLYPMLGKPLGRIKGIYPKYHTIRSGDRWKVGDKFSPRVWSGKPYRSKQIIIAPIIEIKRVWHIEIINNKVIINGVYYGEYGSVNVDTLARNDGLTPADMESWFGKKFFSGQIICWNDTIEYKPF